MSDEEERNTATVRRTLAGYGRLPVDLWLQDYAQDLIYEEPGTSGQVRDRIALHDALARQFAAHPEIAFVLRGMLVSGARVVAEGEIHWQEGAQARVLYQTLWYELHAGRIQRMRVYTQAR